MSISVFIYIGKKRIRKKKAEKPKEKKKKNSFFLRGGVGERKENRVKMFGSKKRSDKELTLLPCDIDLAKVA
jgi:hypothetical protein